MTNNVTNNLTVMEPTKEDKLDEIKHCINQKDSLYYIHSKDTQDFEEKSKIEGKSTIPIMTYGDYTIYLKADCSTIFRRSWGITVSINCFRS